MTSGPTMRPQRWTPPTASTRARAATSAPPLPPVRRIELPGNGPEDVALSPDGMVLTGIGDGSILRIDPSDGTMTTLVNTGGRPLGLHADPDGAVLICDCERGLLRWSPHDGLEVLVEEVDGQRLRFASNVVRDTDGTLYFSSSSSRWSLDRYLGDLLEHSGTGRLLRRDPSGRVETLIDGLQFANGVVLSPDRDFVLVAETGAYRVARYWLTGPKAGTHDLLIENMPGFPDNMALGSDGLVWIALAAPRDRLLDRLLPLPGVLRRLVWALPDWARPKPGRTVWVRAIDFEGRVVHDLQGAGADFSMVTSVIERDGTLYLGSLTESAVAVTRIPA